MLAMLHKKLEYIALIENTRKFKYFAQQINMYAQHQNNTIMG